MNKGMGGGSKGGSGGGGFGGHAGKTIGNLNKGKGSAYDSANVPNVKSAGKASKVPAASKSTPKK